MRSILAASLSIIAEPRATRYAMLAAALITSICVAATINLSGGSGGSGGAGGLGVPLTPPTALNSTASIDNGADTTVRLAHDGGTRWIAVWASNYNLNGTIGTDLDLFRSTSDNFGQTWTAVTTLNTTAASDSNIDRSPSLACNHQGVGGLWLVAWESTNTLGGTLGNDLDILLSRSVDGGVTWSPPSVLNTNAATDLDHDHDPQLAFDSGGVWICAWRSLDSLLGTIGNDADILFARSIDSGVTWTAPLPLNANAATDSGQDLAPRLLCDGSGNCVAVWHCNDTFGGTLGTDYDILMARSSNGGASWSAPQPLNVNATSDSRDDTDAKLATDRNGTWIAVWSSADSLGNTIGIDRDILWARSVNNGQTWSAPQPLNINASSDTGQDTFPTIATDGNGRWIAAWSSTENLAGIGSDLDLLISISHDGLVWSAPTHANLNATNDSGADDLPFLMADANGAWALAWESTDALGGSIGMDIDILMTRFAMPDCNSNSFPDAADIANGSSIDVNQNGIPDECEPPPPSCAADIAPANGDGVVNVNDLLAVINSWGACPSPPAPCHADISPSGGDGAVNVNDLLAVINAWGPCP